MKSSSLNLLAANYMLATKVQTPIYHKMRSVYKEKVPPSLLCDISRCADAIRTYNYSKRWFQMLIKQGIFQRTVHPLVWIPLRFSFFCSYELQDYECTRNCSISYQQPTLGRPVLPLVYMITAVSALEGNLASICDVFPRSSTSVKDNVVQCLI